MEVKSKTFVFFDGNCGLCHYWVRFILSRDRGRNFLFAPRDGTTFQEKLGDAELPDSIIVRDSSGEILSQSSAIVSMLKQLEGPWPLLGLLLSLIPKRLRDALYRFVAAIRRRLLPRPQSACPMISEELRPFLLD